MGRQTFVSDSDKNGKVSSQCVVSKSLDKKVYNTEGMITTHAKFQVKNPTKFTCQIGQFYLVATINAMR